MGKIILYEPVLKPKSGGGCYFRVDGSISRDRDEAVRLASKHCLCKSGEAELVRIDEHEVDEDEIERSLTIY